MNETADDTDSGTGRTHWTIRRAGRAAIDVRDAEHHRGTLPTSADELELGRASVEWTERLVEVARYEVSRADDKANTLFRFYGVVAALGLGLLVGQGWSPSELATAAAASIWIGGAMFLVSGILLGMVLYPTKRSSDDRSRLLYFGDVLEYPTTGTLAEGLRGVEGGVDARLVEQLFVLSRLVDHKFRLTRWALLTLLGGTVATVTAVLLDTLSS